MVAEHMVRLVMSVFLFTALAHPYELTRSNLCKSITAYCRLWFRVQKLEASEAGPGLRQTTLRALTGWFWRVGWHVARKTRNSKAGAVHLRDGQPYTADPARRRFRRLRRSAQPSRPVAPTARGAASTPEPVSPTDTPTTTTFSTAAPSLSRRSPSAGHWSPHLSSRATQN